MTFGENLQWLPQLPFQSSNLVLTCFGKSKLWYNTHSQRKGQSIATVTWLSLLGFGPSSSV